jgi:hypothetical protein
MCCVGASEALVLTRLDYTRLCEFEFENEADNREFDGPAWKHFGAVFQNSIYRLVAFCAPDPMYVFFFGIFGVVDRSIKGTGVGSSCSVRFWSALIVSACLEFPEPDDPRVF